MDAHDHLNSVNASKTAWVLKVRVTRMWEKRSNTGVVLAHNLILLDCLNCHMHAVVTPDIWQQLQNVINEGGLYRIINVLVRPAVGVLRPVTSTAVLHFLTTTIVNVLAGDEGLFIPRHKFELQPLERLHEIVSAVGPEQRPENSTVLEDLEPHVILHTAIGPRELVRFKISDGRISYRVKFWGPLNANTQPLYDENLERPTILILSSVLLSEYRGIIHISSLPFSRIFINLNTNDVISMRQRLLHDEVMVPAAP